jgi:hypothetical protein
MLNAARAQGRPIIVIAMIAAAMSHATAIQMPPKNIHRRLRRSDKGDMGAVRSLAIVFRWQYAIVS